VRTLSAVLRWASRLPAISGARPSPGALKLFVWTSSPSALKKPLSWATKKAIEPIQALNQTR